MIARPYLLDVTRLISRSWTRRKSTGIDRVCLAYLARFGASAHAVIQHRGVFRMLDPSRSDGLFDMLLGPETSFRRKLLAFAPGVLAQGLARVDGEGAIYINVSHTDFDLASHARWIDECQLRPVYMIHDLIPITHAGLCRARAVRRHRGRVTAALRGASGIVVNSYATAEELARYSRAQTLPAPPTLAAPLAGGQLVPAPGAPALRNSPDCAYFICLGTIEERKNHMLLLDVWSSLVAEHGMAAPRLVIAGQWGAGSADVRRRLRTSADLRYHVSVMEALDDAELGALVVGARAMLLPSRAEGFGLPLVEALQLGTPVIASDLPCFREIGQGIPTLVDPHDREAWRRAISGFTGNGADRARQLQLMPHFRRTTWDDHFTRVEPWLDGLPGLSHMQSPGAPAAQRQAA